MRELVGHLTVAHHYLPDENLILCLDALRLLAELVGCGVHFERQFRAALRADDALLDRMLRLAQIPVGQA